MKPKIPALRIKSDGCAINIGQVIEDGEIVNPGTPYYIHQGEWVEILPIMTVKEVVNISRLQNGGSDPSVLGSSFVELCRELSRRVIAWDWTDMMGQPIEQPYDKPDVLEQLSSEELLWLISATTNEENADDRKKGSRRSGTTSLEVTDSPVMSPSG